MNTVCVGVDGCPGNRWVVARATLDPAGDTGAVLEHLEVDVVEDLSALIGQVRRGEVSAVGIDIPIGLLDDHPRPADVEARSLLGPRRSSVFPTPVRMTLAGRSYVEVCELSRAACGKAISKQAFHLLDRIRTIDELIRPEDQSRIVESHPELAFMRLNGGPLFTTKHTQDGRRQRRHLLERELPAQEVCRVLSEASAPAPDLLDALSLVTTARRIACSEVIRLGTVFDSTGKRAEVAY